MLLQHPRLLTALVGDLAEHVGRVTISGQGGGGGGSQAGHTSEHAEGGTTVLRGTHEMATHAES